MDDIVKQAMAKWPNVPHCYGWLALDARGVWRMRDEAAQQAGSAGDKLTNAALVGFINRNYLADERGCWYFQNGPQRVYVNLETAPFIARTDPVAGFMLHTGMAAGVIEHVFLTAAGSIVLRVDGFTAQVDDRDVAQLLQTFTLNGRAATDDDVMAWLENGPGQLMLTWHGQRIPIECLASDEAPARFGFIRQPHPQ